MTICKSDRLKPEFLDEMKMLLGDEYDDFLKSIDSEKTNGIRVNTLKIDIDDFKKIGAFDLNDITEWSNEGFYIDEGVRPGQNPLHDAGAFYVQDPSAMSVVGKTDILRGEKILDMCAAPGGKSTYILSKLDNTGLLVSNEINSSRIGALCDNLERFGAINNLVTNTDSKGLLKFFKGYFDKVFIDAPCSGSGMFRKDEIAISDWSIGKVRECASIQREIIRDGYELLKENGELIYSTCTFSKVENEDIIEDFLNDYPDVSLKSMDRIWPHRDRGEGHFCARLVKGDAGSLKDFSANELFDCDDNMESGRILDNPDFKKSKKSKKKVKNKTGIKGASDYLSLLREFVDLYISADSDFYGVLKNGEISKRGDFLFLDPDIGVSIEGLKVQRKGLLLGEVKKNRFEPSYSLAMAMKKSDAMLSVDYHYDSEEIAKYMIGDVLKSDIDDGWALVCVEGIPLGWAKSTKGVLKNKFPKGLRRKLAL